MRRAFAGVLSGVLVAILVSLGVTSTAGAAPGDECGRAPGNTVLVRTVPAVPFWSFSVAGFEFATGADGTALFPAGLCGQLQPVEQTRQTGPDSRLRFQRWFGGHSGGYTAAFYADHLVKLRFEDPDGEAYPARRIDSMTLKNSLGVREKVKASKEHWLLGSRGISRSGGIVEGRVYWTLEDAVVEGLSVVTRNQLKFYPDETSDPLARVLVFDASVKARDAFFGLAMGDAELELVYPTGRSEFHRFDGAGRLRLENLPRGQYDMLVHTSGLKMKSPVAITRDQEVDLKVLSYLDIAAVLVAGLTLAGGLLLYGRRQRRRRAAARPAGVDDVGDLVDPQELSEVIS